MSDFGYAERPALYASLNQGQWIHMLLVEDPDDRAIREAHGFGYQLPDFPDDAPCRNGCGLAYDYIMAGKVRKCKAARDDGPFIESCEDRSVAGRPGVHLDPVKLLGLTGQLTEPGSD